jgi:hypothetical protein
MRHEAKRQSREYNLRVNIQALSSKKFADSVPEIDLCYVLTLLKMGVKSEDIDNAIARGGNALYMLEVVQVMSMRKGVIR